MWACGKLISKLKLIFYRVTQFSVAVLNMLPLFRELLLDGIVWFLNGGDGTKLVQWAQLILKLN